MAHPGPTVGEDDRIVLGELGVNPLPLFGGEAVGEGGVLFPGQHVKPLSLVEVGLQFGQGVDLVKVIQQI